MLYNQGVYGAFTYNLSVRLRPESGFEILTKCGACQHFLQIFQPALTRTRVYIQEDQDFFMFLLLTINLSIYLYFFEELERFRDSCLLPQGNNQSIAVDLKELTFWLYQTYGQRAGLGWDGAISGIAFLYWAPQPTSIHPPAGSQSFYPRPQKAATNAPYRWAEGHCSGKMKDIVSIQIF